MPERVPVASWSKAIQPVESCSEFSSASTWAVDSPGGGKNLKSLWDKRKDPKCVKLVANPSTDSRSEVIGLLIHAQKSAHSSSSQHQGF